MPIDQDFPGRYHIVGKYRQADSKNYHLVWIPNNETEECSNDDLVQSPIKKR
jgi:hypothetical protein